jgi:hypothetical protein
MSFLALITPLGGGGTGVWPPGSGIDMPAHPIAPGGPGVPTHPIYNPPGIWPSPGVPTHPIAGPPPTIWPSPGVPTHPIAMPPWWPGFPAHPIPPIVGGGPILPPEGTTPPEGTPPIEWHTAWSPSTGWIVVGIPTGEHPVPSEK